MTGVYQGGRQRASSEGDILDESNTGNGTLNPPLNDQHRKVSQSLHLTVVKNVDPVEAIADGHPYQTLPLKQKRRTRPSFKSVKNFMSRFRTSSHSEKSGVEVGGPKGGWTPTLPRKGESQSNKTDKTDLPHGESTSRPLITKPVTSFRIPWEKTPGTVGIHNHGNTCFMNAVLQCLSNTDWFSKYFITKQYRDDLKSKTFSKKLSGMKSDVTDRLGTLIENLWSEKYHPDISSSFKNVVGKCNGQYKGSEQHDAQEFFLWLLDRINEDLVTVSKKKEKVKKSKSVSDEAAAAELLANSSGSLLFNMFQALYRSSLQCANCLKQSNTFETYLCLSLPLPYRMTRPVYVILVLQDNDPQQIKVGLSLNMYDTVKELRQEIASFANTRESMIVLCQIYDDGFKTTYGDDQPLTDIHESETVYAIEMCQSSSPSQGQSNKEYESSYMQIIVVHTEKSSSPTKYSRFCSPVVLQVPREIDYKYLQREILQNMEECIREGLLSQRLDILFHLRVVDGFPGRVYLQEDSEIMPLFTQSVEGALSTYGEEYGPQHLKLVAEWEPMKKERVIVYNNNRVEEHPSVRRTYISHQQPFKVTLDQCINIFTKEETLSGEDAWLCPHCHKQQQGATKTLGLWSLPDVLVIHLKRFRQVGLRRSKLNTLVDFPVRELNMADYIIKPEQGHKGHSEEEMIYDLYGVCNHYGNMSGGHYTAFCKNPLDERWYEFDDSRVKPMSEAEVKTSSAYLLFYQRRGVTEAITEDIQSGSHWVFKLYPITDINKPPHITEITSDKRKKQCDTTREISERPNGAEKLQPTQHTNHSESIRTRKDSVGRQSGYDKPKTQQNSGKVEEKNLIDFSEDDIDGPKIQNQYPQQNNNVSEMITKFKGLSEDSHRAQSMPDRPTFRQINDSPSLQKMRQEFIPSHSVVDQSREKYKEMQTEVRPSSNHAGKPPIKPKSDNRTHEQMSHRENDQKIIHRQPVGRGLSVKLPEKEVFLVRQNNVTGKTVVQKYDSKQVNNILHTRQGSDNSGEHPAWQGKGSPANEQVSWPNCKQKDVTTNSQPYRQNGHDGVASSRNMERQKVKEGNSGHIAQDVPKIPVQDVNTDSRNKTSSVNMLAYDARASFRAEVKPSDVSESIRQNKGPVRQSSISMTPQQPRKADPTVNSEFIRNAWSTPQTHRKSPPTVPPRPDFIRQLSHPTKPGQGPPIENGLPPRSQNDRSSASRRSKSQQRPVEMNQSRANEMLLHDQRLSNGDIRSYNDQIATKFATIARVNHRRSREEEFHESRSNAMPRSKTENSIKDTPMQNSYVADSPNLHQARSRRPVYDSNYSQDPKPVSEEFYRYRPHKHYIKSFQNKTQEMHFRKEKLYSPCQKESSV